MPSTTNSRQSILALFLWSAARLIAGADEPFDAWGTTVNGLRLQLVAVRKEYVVGETMYLMLLFRNVSDKEVDIPGMTLDGGNDQ